MKGILNFIFRPSTHDKDAVKSIFKDMMRTTNVVVIFVLLVVTGFLVWTFINPAVVQNSLFYHRMCYILYVEKAINDCLHFLQNSFRNY